MKKKKKVIKNKKLMKRVKIILLVVLLVGFGVIGLMVYRSTRYMNSVVINGNGCGKGYYFYNYIITSGCEKCKKGFYCPGDNKYYACEKGLTTAGSGSVYSSSCKYCSDESKYYSNGKCLKCKQGYYCEGGKLNQCPSGKTTKGTGAKRSSECVCKAGTYASGKKCVACPKCNGSTVCFTSPIGSTSVNKCTGTVPAGKYITCNGSGCTVKSCASGTYSKKTSVTYKSNLSTSCSKCPKDKIPNFSRTDCICKAGTYTSGSGCKACPKCNGNITCFDSVAGASSATSCAGTVPAGKYITCNSSGCKVNDCTGNTYSKSTSVRYSSSLKTTCKSCGNKKANSNHSGCV